MNQIYHTTNTMIFNMNYNIIIYDKSYIYGIYVMIRDIYENEIINQLEAQCQEKKVVDMVLSNL